MPEMTVLGWFHTLLGVGAVLSGFYTIYKHRVISLEEDSGRLYVYLTLLVAGSALGTYINCSYWRCNYGKSKTVWIFL